MHKKDISYYIIIIPHHLDFVKRFLKYFLKNFLHFSALPQQKSGPTSATGNQVQKHGRWFSLLLELVMTNFLYENPHFFYIYILMMY